MATETIKSLREKADELIDGGITNREALYKALPIIIDLKARLDSATKNIAASTKSLTMLSELCSRYVLAHESVFEKQKLIPTQQGVRVGDIVLEEATYHFSNGFDGYERDDDGKLTQDFLKTLPEAWRKQSYKISTTGIDGSNPTDNLLEKHHLRPKEKNVWTIVEEA